MALPRLGPSARVGEQAFDVLQTAIINGDLQVGQRLRIRELANELGTSVMPVREAIARLEEVGLVETPPHRSAVVKGFTYRELLDLYSVRQLLEVEATKLGVPRLTPALLDRMEAEYQAMLGSLADTDPTRYLNHDESFLTIVYEASGNVVLSEMIRNLWYRCRSYKLVGARQSIQSGSLDALIEHQQNLLGAARAGDVSHAGDITAASLRAATDRIRTALHVSGETEDVPGQAEPGTIATKLS